MQDTSSIKRNWQDKIASYADPFVGLRMTGLDISDLTIKYIAFSKHRRNRIQVALSGEIAIPEGIIASGEIKNEHTLSEILASWFRKERKKLSSPFVTVSLPEEKSFVRLVQIPLIKTQEVEHAIRWEIENQIPLPVEDVVYDYELIQPPHDQLDHRDVLITAFPRDMLEAYVRVIKAAGLRPYAMELESQAMVRACAVPLQDTVAKIILDIGRTRTNIVIFSGGAILYSAALEVGGLMFEQIIAKTLAINQPEAQRLKIEVGLDKTQVEARVFSALIPTVTILADEILRAMAYYRTHATHAHGAGSEIENILISGGDANLRGLDTYLASAVRVRVQIADPFSSVKQMMTQEIPPLTKREALAFTTAIGLALRDIRE